MNKEVKHLYQELSNADKKQLAKEFEQSPKMLLYIEALENANLVTTQKAVKIIYETDQELVEDNVLINRFYKLRSTLRLHLLKQLRNRLKSTTNEEAELQFLKLLFLKNEYAYVLKKAKKLQKICWKDNIFELLPDLLDLIIKALHAHQSTNRKEIATYIEQLSQVNELLYTLHLFKNLFNTFKSEAFDYKNLEKHYLLVLTKMRRKAALLKNYPRFSLIYHHTGFSIGCQFFNTVSNTSNVLTRHLNKLEKILAQYPNMPILDYISNHRVYVINSLLIRKATYWYHKRNFTKSYQYILDNEQLRAIHPSIYMIRLGNDFYNILACCWEAREYKAVLKYSQKLKEFQITNSSINNEIPYFVYELLAYNGLYSKSRAPNPLQLIYLTERFLKQTDSATTAWIYDTVGSFALLYGFIDRSRVFLEYCQADYELPTLELLNIVESKNRQEIKEFCFKIKKAKKQASSQEIMSHLNQLETLTSYFL